MSYVFQVAENMILSCTFSGTMVMWDVVGISASRICDMIMHIYSHKVM